MQTGRKRIASSAFLLIKNKKRREEKMGRPAEKLCSFL
jgi:hypothetical protein